MPRRTSIHPRYLLGYISITITGIRLVKGNQSMFRAYEGGLGEEPYLHWEHKSVYICAKVARGQSIKASHVAMNLGIGKELCCDQE